MSDWSAEPALSQTWANFLASIQARDVSVAKMDFTGDTNIPTGSIRWNTTASQFESYDGATWSVLSNVAQTANVVPNTRTISAGSGLTGGGDLSANRTLSLANMADSTVKGRAVGAGTGAPTDLSAAQLLAIVAGASNGANGINAQYLNGLSAATTATANTVAARDSSGYLFATYLNQGSANSESFTVSQFMCTNGIDGYLRKANVAAVQGALGSLSDTANALMRRDSTGYGSVRVIRNSAGSGSTQDGMYIGYGNGGSGITRIYGGGSTTNNVQIDGSGNVVATGNVTAYSDVRLKEDLRTVEGALTKIMRLRGYTFTRKDLKGAGRQVGVIAQEVQEVFPELVSKDEQGILGVSYGNMVAVLIEALRELNTKVEALH